MQATINLKADIAIIGGGIAGLWLLNRLCNSGYNALLFEQQALGGYQTIASQGMIHGGIKYTLSGTLNSASEAIADMPDHWRRCLRGEGDVDLRNAKILSDHFYMFSNADASSKITTFFASKATRGRVEKVKSAEYPSLFQTDQFKGSLYRLVDMVLDVPTVITALANNYVDRIFRIDWSKAHLQRDANNTIALHFNNGIALAAKRFVFSAGQGNEALLKQLDIKSPDMQRRPLQQVMVKHHNPHQFYGHCLGAKKTPRLTVSSHPCEDGDQVWYLGGSLAERNAGKPAEEAIADAKTELADLLPWVDLTNSRWASVGIDRAEPRQRNLARPDKAFAVAANGCTNVLVAWPTKLTLSPNLADEVIALLGNSDIGASGEAAPDLSFLERPQVAPTPWEVAFG